MLVDGGVVGPDGPLVGIARVGPPIIGVVVGFVRDAVLAAFDKVPPDGSGVVEVVGEGMVVVVFVLCGHDAGFGALDHNVCG